LQEVAVWGRNAAAARALAESLALEGLPAVAVQDLSSAAQAADIVCCATTATAPVVQGSWLRAGTHLDLVGAFRPHMREVDDAAVLRARIVVDGPGALVEAGDLVQPLASGCITRAQVAGDLADLLCGRLPARPELPQDTSQDPSQDLSLFKSVGMALQDLAAAQAVLTSD
jgi:ornithine cyclodeaminase